MKSTDDGTRNLSAFLIIHIRGDTGAPRQIDANASPSIPENAAALGFRSDNDASTASDSAATRPWLLLSSEFRRRRKLDRMESEICGANSFR